MPKSILSILAIGIFVGSVSGPATAQQRSAAPTDNAQTTDRGGARDFDFEFGRWATNVRVLRHPLSEKVAAWSEYRGISVVRPLMEGKANVVELSLKGPGGGIEGVSLRLYNPQTRQWSLNFASFRNGMLTAPVYGSFDGSGIGTFYGQDMLDGRAIIVRFVISQKAPDEAHFVQSYSADGGVTWEVNWVAVDTRLADS